MYKLEHLPSAQAGILEIDAYLYEHSPAASDNFFNSIECLEKNLVRHPFMYPVFEDDPFFRHMALPYKYRLFYHVDEDIKAIKICRILHGARNVKGIIEAEPL